MKYALLLLLLLPFSLLPAQQRKNSFYKSAPSIYSPVNDYALLLSVKQQDLLAKKIRHFKDSTGNVLVIITQNNLFDATLNRRYSIEDAALGYFNKWKIGQKEQNNGVLIFVAREERQVRIATGKGIDSILTDEDCRRIISEDLIPSFKNNDYYTGLNNGIDAVTNALGRGDFVKQTTSEVESPVNTSSYTYDASQGKSIDPVNISIGLVIALILLIMAGTAFSGNHNSCTTGYGTTYGCDPYHTSRSWWHYWFVDDHIHHRNNDYGSSFSTNSNDTASSGNDSSSAADTGSFGGGSSDGGGASGSW